MGAWGGATGVGENAFDQRKSGSQGLCHPERRARSARSRRIPLVAALAVKTELPGWEAPPSGRDEPAGGGAPASSERTQAWVATSEKAAVKGFVILSAGREAPGVEGSHWSRCLPVGRERVPSGRFLRTESPPSSEKAAIKGRWAGVPIDPAAYGSRSCEFALRNLHKSPEGRVGASTRLRRALGLCPPPSSGDWCRFRAAGRGSGAPSTCGRPAGAGGSSGRMWVRAPRRLRRGLPLWRCGLRKSGNQGSMGRCAHRPCCLWFALLRVRLTKPPQIAGGTGRGFDAPAAGARAVPASVQRRLVQVSCGWPRVGSASDPRAPAGAVAGARAAQPVVRNSVFHPPRNGFFDQPAPRPLRVAPGPGGARGCRRCLRARLRARCPHCGPVSRAPASHLRRKTLRSWQEFQLVGA